jgi:transcriptional regulator with XRE-family HTH domain
MKNETRPLPALAAGESAGSPNLGASLRRLRFQRRLSIAEVSALTGIAKSTLSRVENDQLSLTYSKLLQLCRGLKIDVAELFSEHPDRDAARPSARRTFTLPRAGQQLQVGLQEYSYLCTELAGKKMTPMLGTIRSRTLAESNGLLKHEGEEFTYVLAGRLELHTEYYAPLILEAGGSVYFDSTMGHAYLSIGSEPLEILSICTTPEHVLEQTLERAQLSADAAATPDVRTGPASRGKPQVRTTRRTSRPR